jgi:hypothetical protein
LKICSNGLADADGGEVGVDADADAVDEEDADTVDEEDEEDEDMLASRSGLLG